jgi:hypothetical protein
MAINSVVWRIIVQMYLTLISLMKIKTGLATRVITALKCSTALKRTAMATVSVTRVIDTYAFPMVRSRSVMVLIMIATT